MTPPLDEQEEREESRVLESEARKELETEGCPPCYPANVDIPLESLPHKDQAIVSYWRSFPGTGDVVLCAQLSDWRKFREYQQRVRHFYENKGLSDYMDRVRERRRRHKLHGDVDFRRDLDQQSRLENWIEFQDYHLRRLEQLDQKRDEWSGKLDAGRAIHAAENTEVIQQNLGLAEHNLKRHKVLLQWIEQERRVIHRVHSMHPEDRHNENDGIPASSRIAHTRDHQQVRPKASAVHGEVRIRKIKLKKRIAQIHKPKGPEPRPAIKGSKAELLGSVPNAPDHRYETLAQLIKKTAPLHPFYLQRRPKSTRFAGASAGPLGETQLCDVMHNQGAGRAHSKRRLTPQRTQFARNHFVTRSGRISKPPLRWAPT